MQSSLTGGAAETRALSVRGGGLRALALSGSRQPEADDTGNPRSPETFPGSHPGWQAGLRPWGHGGKHQSPEPPWWGRQREGGGGTSSVLKVGPQGCLFILDNLTTHA